MKTNREKYNCIFTELFEVNESELNDRFNFGIASKWDSLAHLELITQIEDTFEIMLETDDITHFGGYENGKKILAKYGIEM
ncbi:acyl carrier protein [Blautia schinkii]|nr:acyl carrier protein [Blautia schinkii]